jgi:hypothetical protein
MNHFVVVIGSNLLWVWIWNQEGWSKNKRGGGVKNLVPIIQTIMYGYYWYENGTNISMHDILNGLANMPNKQTRKKKTFKSKTKWKKTRKNNMTVLSVW